MNSYRPFALSQDQSSPILIRFRFIRYSIKIVMSQKNLGNKSAQFTRKKIQAFSYGLNDVIGKGYSSQVYRGRNDQTNENVAIKVIDLKMLKNDINKILLQSQIEILKELQSLTNILHLHDVFTTKNNTYIVTELCDSDLNKHIKRKLTQPEVFYYMEQLIAGYQQFQAKEIVHRDLKPANLLITEDNRLKIADFGFGVKAEEVLKPSKYNVGSPLYMAPESLKKNEYSYKSDIWAIGIIFFEMLTCETPWKAKNEKELVKKIQTERIEDIVQKKNISGMSKEFLISALRLDKGTRMSPTDMERYYFKPTQGTNILMQRKLNFSVKPNNRLQNQQNFNLTSPKYVFDRSVEKKVLAKELNQQKFTSFRDNTNENVNLRPALNKTTSIQSQNNKKQMQERKENPQLIKKQSSEINKEQKKAISKILIAEVHFCRFLFKLLIRIKQSIAKGLLKDFNDPSQCQDIFLSYTAIIKHKIQNLNRFQETNYIKAQNYEQYKQTSDYRKLQKISKEYQQRYCTQLKDYWNKKECIFETSDTNSMIIVYCNLLNQAVQEMQNPRQQITLLSSDIVILDYLMTARQLIDLLKDGENYERFAKKSHIQQIVEGKTGEVKYQLFEKIMQRAKRLIFEEGPTPTTNHAFKAFDLIEA